eukprot:6391332-Amphidinium_carterae.1
MQTKALAWRTERYQSMTKTMIVASFVPMAYGLLRFLLHASPPLSSLLAQSFHFFCTLLLCFADLRQGLALKSCDGFGT